MKLIDTSWLIELLKKQVYEEGAISIITLIEVLRGIEASKRGKVKKLLEECFNILNLDNKVIEIYCKLYNELREKGELIPDADLLVASTALAHNLSLKSKDKHFDKLRSFGLKLEPVK